MSNPFFDSPILNSPYKIPTCHWELDDKGQPTQQVINHRRKAEFITPIPKPRGRTKSAATGVLEIDEIPNVELTSTINDIRQQVETWRRLSRDQWQVTPITQQLLEFWRSDSNIGIRPFFCQVEAVETLIWLTEVAPKSPRGKSILERLARVSNEANEGLLRISLKLATGAGKTTVMAMIIAWQTLNAIRVSRSSIFTKGFLLVAPGITIKDRLRVLQPNDPDAYYKARGIVPADLLGLMDQAKIVITNYHAFKLRERIEVSKGGRALLKGLTGSDIQTQETPGQMLQRVMPELLGMRGVMVINDEAHHCYREKPDVDAKSLFVEDASVAEENRKAARLWISGLESLNGKIGINRVIDLSATPFFLQGSGYPEGTLFPWTVSDFSLMDAIECGIVKLPRVPVSDNISGDNVPMFRELWKHIGKSLPKTGRVAGKRMDPMDLPVQLLTALEALYGHYKQVYDLWESARIGVPPCFIVVCNNTTTSKLVFDYISGWVAETDAGSLPMPGRLELFRNIDEYGNPTQKLRTLLIDSAQLESGDMLTDSFKKIAAKEIDQFRREIIERTGDMRQAENITDEDLLREVMNTVGKKGKLGESIRCVVSVSMLTEGWDTNTVTHVLGVRAFGTQLLCEQVIGRALRRQSYDLNEQGLFDVEYADVLGIPFDFTAKPVVATPKPPRPTVHVKAVNPEREHLEIVFPNVTGYRSEPLQTKLTAEFSTESKFELSPGLVGATNTENSGIIGEATNLTLAHTRDTRKSTLVMHLTKHLLETRWRDKDGIPEHSLFNDLRVIVRKWLDEYLICSGDTYPAQLIYKSLADAACEKIQSAIVRSTIGDRPILALTDPYNPIGSSRSVNYQSSNDCRWETVAEKCHVNWAVLDSDWEREFCKVVEAHANVLRYVKNSGLGFEVPYRCLNESRKYLPDFIVIVDDGNGPADPLNLIVEIKGYRGFDADMKKEAMEVYWVPGVNNRKEFGRWHFIELTNVDTMANEFHDAITRQFDTVIRDVMNKGTN